MISPKILIAVSTMALAFILVVFTAVRLSQPIPDSMTDDSNLKFTQDLQNLYEASQSALLKLVDNPYILPYPGILPNHPFYWTKMIRDRIQLITTNDATLKMRLLLLFADKRLAAGQLLVATGDQGLGISTITKAEKYLLGAYEIYRNYDKPEKERFKQYIGDAFNRHLIYTELVKQQSKATLKLDSLNQLQDVVRTIYNSEFSQLHIEEDNLLGNPENKEASSSANTP